MRWVLGREDVFLNTVGDLQLLPHVLDAAEHVPDRPDDQTMTALVDHARSPLFT